MTGVLHDKNSGRRSFPSDKLAMLRKHPIFCDLESEAFDQLCRYAKHTTLKRGATLFSKGDPGNSLCAVISGTVKMSISSPDGRSAIFNLIGPGEIFGEIAVLDGQSRTADATANASALIRLADKHKLAPGDRTIAVTQQEISEMVGMTRESINKQLRVWATRKWVRLEHGAIVVLDAEPLQALVEAGSGGEGD